MKNWKKQMSLLLAMLMLAGLAAGCSGTGSTATATPAPTEAPAAFNLSVCLASNPQTIDPALNSAVDGATMLLHFFEGLMKWVDDGSGNAVLVNGQAESYEKAENSDGTVTYTFKLRDDIKWSDGQTVVAGDFVYAWQRLVDPATAADYNYMADMVVNANEIMAGDKEPSTLGVSAPDDSTLVVNITYDCPYFMEVCAFPALLPVRKDIIEATGDQWTFDPATYLSNGPYKMTEWTQNSQIVAVPTSITMMWTSWVPTPSPLS
jgi:oligopeptide transport system substrate-binding protein